MSQIISEDTNTIMFTGSAEEYERIRAHLAPAFPNYTVIHFNEMMRAAAAGVAKHFTGKFAVGTSFYEAMQQRKGSVVWDIEVDPSADRFRPVMLMPSVPGKTIANIGDLMDAALPTGEGPGYLQRELSRMLGEIERPKPGNHNNTIWVNPRQMGKTNLIRQMLADHHRPAKVVAKSRIRMLQQYIDTTYIGKYPTGTIPKRSPFDMKSPKDETLSFIIPSRGKEPTKRIDLDKRNCKERAYTELASKATVIYHCVWCGDRMLSSTVFKA